jgi:hypothetical protein
MSDKRKTTKVAGAVIAILPALIFMIRGVASGASDTNSHLSYLPLVKNGIVQPTVFGAEIMSAITKSRGVDIMVDAGMSWLRYNSVDWSEIEPTYGDFHWDLLDELKSVVLQPGRKKYLVRIAGQ